MNLSNLKNQIELYQNYDDIKGWIISRIMETEERLRVMIKTKNNELEKVNLYFKMTNEKMDKIDLKHTRFKTFDGFSNCCLIYAIVREYEGLFKELDMRVLNLHKTMKSNKFTLNDNLKVQETK